MQTTLKNDMLTVVSDSKGALLCSILSRDSSVEYLWQPEDSSFRSSTFMFPFISGTGGLKLKINGAPYTVPYDTDILKSREYTLEELNDNSVTYLFKSDKEAYSLYPFSFMSYVKYTISDNRLICTLKIKNTGRDRMYFYVGADMRLRVPLEKCLSFTNYSVEYEKKETITQHIPVSVKRTVLDSQRRLRLSRRLFDFGRIDLINPDSTSVSLVSDMSNHSASVEFTGSGAVGIYAVPNSDCDDYISVQPMLREVDLSENDGLEELTKRKNVESLDGGCEFIYEFSVVIK